MRFAIAFLLVVTCVLTVMILIINQSSLVPYNVRELVITEYPIISSFLFTCFMCWSFGFPVWLAMWFQKKERKVWLFPGVALIHGVVAWIILRFAVPVESISDILGSQILSLPWELEYIGRFIPLYFIVTFSTIFAALACLVIFHEGKRATLINYLMFGVVLAPISHWVVVEKAATDNLTELMASGGAAFSSCLAGVFIVIMAFTASQLALLTTKISRNLRKIIIISCIISFPAAFLSIYSATEKTIIKYGQEFSALQFLLSPGREHYVQIPELLIRYAIAHTGAILLIALLQVPFWIWIPDNNKESIHLD